MTVKRTDRTIQMMRELEKNTADALEKAALKLQMIAKESVSRRYTKKPRRPRSLSERIQADIVRKQNARKYFLSLPAKKQDGT